MSMSVVQSLTINERVSSKGTNLTVGDDYLASLTAKDRVCVENIKMAKLALNDRSPSYLNSKLVSRTSLQE